MYICVEEVRAQKLWMKDGQCYNVCEENLFFRLILYIPILTFFLLAYSLNLKLPT